jgi:hypothetical protein
MRRFSAIGLFSAVALALVAQAAGAGFRPTIAATSDQSGNTALIYSQATTDDPVAAVTFEVPPIYLASLGARDLGSTIGAVSATVSLAGATAQAIGTLTQASATSTVSIGGTQTPVATLATACTGSATHGDFWVATVNAAGQSLQVPMYVDAVLLDTPLSQYSAYQIKICLPAPSLVQVVSLSIDLVGVFTVPTGWNVWHAIATPYNADGTVNTAGSVLAESQDRSPQGVTLRAHAAKAVGRVVVSGKVTQGGRGVAGATVKILAGKTTVGTAKSKSGGAYTATVKTKARTLVADATVGARGLPGCVQPILAPLQCVTATVGGFSVRSDAIKVTT